MIDAMLMGFPAASSHRRGATRYHPGGEVGVGASKIGAIVIGAPGSRIYVGDVETRRNSQDFVVVPANTRVRFNVHTFDTVYSVRLTLKEGPPRRLVVGEDIPAAQRRGVAVPISAPARVNLLRFDAAEVMVDGLVPERQEDGPAGMRTIWLPAGRHELRLLGPASAPSRYATVEVAPAEIRDMTPYDFTARADTPAPTFWVPLFVPGFVFTAAPDATDWPEFITRRPTHGGVPTLGPLIDEATPDPTIEMPAPTDPADAATDPPAPDPTDPGPDPTSPSPLVDGGTPKPSVSTSPFAEPGLVEFEVTPAEAVLSLNGAALAPGRKSASLPPGAYPLRVTAPGYTTYEATVTVRSGFVETVRVRLERAATQPGGAKAGSRGLGGAAKVALGAVAVAVTGGVAWGGYRWWKQRQIAEASPGAAEPSSSPAAARTTLGKPRRPTTR